VRHGFRSAFHPNCLSRLTYIWIQHHLRRVPGFDFKLFPTHRHSLLTGLFSSMATLLSSLGYLASIIVLLCSVITADPQIDPNAIRPRPPGFQTQGQFGPIGPEFPQFTQPRPGFQPRPRPRPRPRPITRPNPRPRPALGPPPQPARPQQRCTSFKIRREWRTLSETEQLNYVAAMRCMMKLPTKAAQVMKPPGLVSRFDDFSFTHITLADKVHYVVCCNRRL
jgi:hypothetical protein